MAIDARVALVPVSYCDPENIRRLASSVQRQTQADARLVVVDNCPESREEELSRVLDGLEVAANVVRPGTNLNYWRGGHFGVQWVRERHGLPEWTVVMNSDMELAPDFVEQLTAVDGARANIVAPRIVRASDGEEQNPFMLEPLSRFRRFYWWLHGRSYWVAKALTWARDLWKAVRGSRRRPGWDASLRRQVIWAPHGACVCFHRSFFERGGFIETEFEMYAEELSVGAIAEEKGLTVLYEPAVHVIHYQTLPPMGGVDRHRYELARQSYRQFIEKYG